MQQEGINQCPTYIPKGHGYSKGIFIFTVLVRLVVWVIMGVIAYVIIYSSTSCFISRYYFRHYGKGI